MRRVALTVPAPEGMGIAVLRVRAGSDLMLDLRLESVVEGVLLTGSATASVDGECVRCLDDLQQSVTVDFQELYLYNGAERPAEDEDELFEMHGDLLDLDPVLRNALVLALPLQPVCRDDCPGLCADCGSRMADDPDHRHETVDVRWAALAGMLDGGGAAQSDADSGSPPHGGRA